MPELTVEQKAAAREKSRNEIQGMIDKSVAVETAKTEEMRKKLEADQADFQLKVKAWEESMNAHQRAISLPGAELDQKGKKKFSFARFAAAVAKGSVEKYAPQEFDYIKETHKAAGKESELRELEYKLKTQQLGVDSTGGYLVAPQISSELIEDLRDKPLLSQMGARTIANITGGEFRMPKKTGAGTIYYVAEGTAPTASTLTFGQSTMRPHRAKALIRVSNDLEALANPDIDAIVRSDLNLGFALSVDLKGFRGTGSADEPTGLINAGSGLNTVSCAGAVTMAKLHDFPAAIEQDLALQMEGGRFSWVFNPRTMNVIRQFTNAVTGDYFFRPEAWGMQKPSILGYPFFTSNQVPKTLSTGGLTNVAEVYFGNWAECIIGYWGGLELQAFNQVNLSSTAAAALLDEIWIYAVLKYDVMFRHNESFCVCTDTTS